MISRSQEAKAIEGKLEIKIHIKYYFHSNVINLSLFKGAQ